mmetsp:Transcript_34628/g.64135  ORF Transcript_34628/g.64135 Transcript_34628/m.64135 type:complete len:549 (+) Transcript_34628:728-2374(+)
MIKKKYYNLLKNITHNNFNNYSIKNIDALVVFNLRSCEKNINYIFNCNKEENYANLYRFKPMRVGPFFLNKLLMENSVKKYNFSFSIFLSGCFGKTSMGFVLSNILNDLSSNFCTYTDYFIISNKYIFNIYDKKLINRHKLDQNILSVPNIKKKYLITLSDINQFEIIPISSHIKELGPKISLFELSSSKFNHGKFVELEADIILFNNFTTYKSTNCENKNSISFKQLIIDFLVTKNTLSIVDEEDQFSEKHFFHNKNNFLITYSSFDEDSDIYSNKISYCVWCTQVEVRTPIENIYFETDLVGKHNVHNILTMYSLGFALNIPANYVNMTINKIESIPDRMQRIDAGQHFNLSIDYSETVEGISEIIKSIYESCQTKIFLIYGSSGNLDGNINETSVNTIYKCTEKLFITNTNPKWINTDRLFYETIKGVSTDIVYKHSGSVYDWIFELEKIPIWFQFWLYYYQNNANFYTFHNRSLAIRICLAMVKKDDIIVISGRGSNDIYEKLDDDGKKIQYYYNDLQETLWVLENLAELHDMKIKSNELPWKL